jgi:long-subunit acyl-CoA synthetase (AMP-forming)
LQSDAGHGRKDKRLMSDEHGFDLVLSSNTKIPAPIVNNIAELLFTALPHRAEDAVLILSHENETSIEVSLPRLRYVVSSLYKQFEEKNIHPGDTVLLATLSVNTEVYTIMLFTALVSYGARVLFPMFVETAELDTWVKHTGCRAVIFPEKEIQQLHGYEKQKQVIRDIRTVAEKNNLSLFDAVEDFHLTTYLHEEIPHTPVSQMPLVQQCIQKTNMSTESVIFTTSGSSGKSKLVLYEQGAFLRNCACWQQSGLYRKEKLGGRSFLDILPHTVSIRALFNAYWTGYGVCIVNTEWVKQKPQKILPFLVKMKPQVMTLAPASYAFIVELLKLVPEVKNLAFSELHTVVSTSAPFSKKTAQDMKQYFGLYLHNAYGLSETQQVLTTLLCDETDLNGPELIMGKPIAGVVLGLRRFDDTMYQLFVKSPYGHKAIISENITPADEFFNTGDIVKLSSNNVLIFVGREQKDFVKSGYGAKVPLVYLKEYYKELYHQVSHIEFRAFETFTFSFGIAALIFITDEHLPKGRVTDKKTIKRFYKKIKTINKSLFQRLEPFEYDHQTITRFLLVNSLVTYTFKGTVSGSTIETHFSKELSDLLYSDEEKTGVKNLTYLNSAFIKILLHYTPLRAEKIRRIILKMLLRH